MTLKESQKECRGCTVNYEGRHTIKNNNCEKERIESHVPLLVIRGAEEHILPERGVLDPGRLADVADAATHCAAAI